MHFPIALLVLYSIIKIVPFSRWFPRVAWKDIERVLLAVGLLGAYAAIMTGENARSLNLPPNDLVEWHRTFARLSTWLYGALLIGEVSAIANARLVLQPNAVVKFLERIFNHKVFSRLIAAAALVSITVTGMLGGAMVFGPTADPLAGLVLRLLGISL